jgi:phage shock protein A
VGKTWNYIKAWFGKKTEEVKDPEIEIEQAIQEAQKRDQQLRNQAAQVIAHRTNVAAELEDASSDMAEARELAKQALLRADAATKAGNAAEAEKWNATASQIAMKMQASQNTVNMLTEQLKTADVQAQKAKDAVKNNATAVQELAARRMQLLGQLEAAKMQESVNKAVDAMTATVGTDAPSLEEVEDKIQARMAQATAKAELTEATSPEAAIAELKAATSDLKAASALDDLRAELGLTPAPELPASSAPPPASPPPPAPPAS